MKQGEKYVSGKNKVKCRSLVSATDHLVRISRNGGENLYL